MKRKYHAKLPNQKGKIKTVKPISKAAQKLLGMKNIKNKKKK